MSKASTPKAPEAEWAEWAATPGPRYYNPDKNEAGRVVDGVRLGDYTAEEYAALPDHLKRGMARAGFYDRAAPAHVDRDAHIVAGTYPADASEVKAAHGRTAEQGKAATAAAPKTSGSASEEAK